MKNQFRQLLRDIGFYHRRDHEVYNENSDNAGLVKAVLVAGLYPNVVKLELPPATKNSGRNTNRNKPKRPPVCCGLFFTLPLFWLHVSQTMHVKMET